MSLVLLLGGKQTPFYSASINYSLDQLAHTFSANIEMDITTQLDIEFLLNNQSIFSGQIDKVSSSTESASHSISISGRSKCAHMIDSKITMDAVYDQPLDKLLSKVASDYGLTVSSKVTTKAVDEFQINAESPIDNLAQLVREQGFLLVEREGVLVIEKPAHTQANLGLTVGKNLQSLSIERNFSARFNKIEVEGAWELENKGVAIDSAINTSRTKVIVADQLQTQEACQSRAEYEKNLGIANSLTASASLPFLTNDMAINQLNNIISVTDKQQNFNQSMVIKAISLSVTDSEEKTGITLALPFTEKKI